MVSLLTRTLATDYRADVFSFATLIYLIGFVITWLGPFLIIYGSGKVWNPVSLLNPTQAQVRFKHELIMKAVVGEDGDFLAFGNLFDYNDLFRDHVRVPSIKVSEVDDDGDEVTDCMDMEVSFPLKEVEQVYQMELLLLFEYYLENQKFMMESLAYIEVVPGFPRSSVEVVGDLRLVQSELLPHFLGNPFNASIIKVSSSFELIDILRHYHNRSVRTELKVTSIFTKMSIEEGHFTLKVKVNYPRQANIMISTSPFVLFKWAFIQYFYVVLLFIFIFSLINKHVFSNKLVTSVTMPGVM